MGWMISYRASSNFRSKSLDALGIRGVFVFESGLSILKKLSIFCTISIIVVYSSHVFTPSQLLAITQL